jgi:hypothetical protein
VVFVVMLSARDLQLEANAAAAAASLAESSAAHARDQLLSAQQLLQVRLMADT